MIGVVGRIPLDMSICNSELANPSNLKDVTCFSKLAAKKAWGRCLSYFRGELCEVEIEHNLY